MTHPKLHRAFLRGVRFLDREGVWIVQLGRFRGQIEVEDTPYWVRAYDPSDGGLSLSDETAEPLAPETLSLDPDGVLRCRVKGTRFPARFTQSGQAHLLDALELGPTGWLLRVGERLVPTPSLPPP